MTEVASHRKTFKDRFLKTASRNRLATEDTDEEPKRKQLKRLPQYIAYKIFRLAAELTAVFIGVACLWFFALNSLITRQSVDVTGLKPNAQMWFSQAFNGSDAQIGGMSLSWLSASNTILFEATDVVVTDENGAEIETIPRLQTEIPMQAASKGKIIPKRVIINGGTVTWLRDENGSVVAGLGTPNTVGKLGPVWRGLTQNPRRKADIRGVETVTITNATAFIVDEADGLDLMLTDTDINFRQSSEDVDMQMTSNLQKDEVKIPLQIKFKTSSGLSDFTLGILTSGLNPSFLSPERGRYSWLKGFDANLDIKANLKVGREQGLQTADVDINGSSGRVEFGEFETEFNGANIAARLSAESQDMDITSIGLRSDKLSFSGSGTLGELGALTDGNINSSPVFDLVFEDVKIDRRPSFSVPLNFSRMDVLGRLDIDARRLDLERLLINLGTYEYDLGGTLAQNEAGKWSEIALKGHANGTLTPPDVLSAWPVNFAKGARDWIERSVLKGAFDNLKFDVNFDEETLRSGIPKDDSVSLDFDISDGEVRYIQTMTSYQNVTGRGSILGNSARVEAYGGNVGNLEVSTALVEIPRLLPKGGDLTITVNGNGATSDMLTLIDQKPFEFPSQFGIVPETFGGTGVIDLKVTRPLLVEFERSRIIFDIGGKFSDVTAPVQIGSHNMKDGNITVTANNAGMNLNGPVNIGPWATQLNWDKKYDFGKTPSRYQIVGKMDRDTLDSFGLGFREYFDGDINVEVNALGDGLDLTAADISADLTDVGIQIGQYWTKAKGTAGEFKGQLNRQSDGGIQFENMSIDAPGLTIAGRVDFANKFKLVDMDLPTVKVDGLIDAGIQMKPDNLSEKLSVFVRGDFLNVSSLVSNALSDGKGVIDVPVLLTANLNKIALNENYIVNNANVLFSHNGLGITNAHLGGQTDQGPLNIQMRSFETGQARDVDVSIPSAADAARAFLGLDNIEGGELKITAQFPPIGKAGTLNGVAEIDEFKLVRAPILAHMLSLGSLTGIFDTLGGGGLSFNTFHVPFSLIDGELHIRNARVSGPALGMTGDGEIRFKDRLLDVDGTLVPAYTANSLLGDIPVLGDLFVGKKGEGIFALSFMVQGEFDNTQVTVNPLSALTPGFLRGIFKPKRESLPEEVIAEIRSVAPN